MDRQSRNPKAKPLQQHRLQHQHHLQHQHQHRQKQPSERQVT